MHEMQTTVTNVHRVCLSQMHQMTPARLHCVGSFGAAFAKVLWHFVFKIASQVVFSLTAFCHFILMFLKLPTPTNKCNAVLAASKWHHLVNV